MRLFLLVMLVGLSEAGHRRRPSEKSHKRIVGGERASIKKSAFVLSLTRLPLHPNSKSEHICGASIIKRYWALTAAHCLFKEVITGISKDEVILHGNSTSLSIRDRNKIQHKISGYYVHSKFNSRTLNNDIAILGVKDPFDGLFEKPIPMPPYTYVYKEESLAQAFGWGRTIPNRLGVSPSLRKVKLILLESLTCQWMFRVRKIFGVEITSNMFCVGGVFDKDTCQGDSGGPLTQNGKLIGIVSWGGDCASYHFPGVYTKVAVYDRWINQLLDKQGTRSQNYKS
ncbi:hypothetical protein ILUMI_13783 [Ignelater luminosus]|uniref:Peptidase S1 domain-containing protein n=1 Tax=Ignelater luminosus TaxID=2038154 RepID=A0A8K0D025_IGNLU|nr:hypothetical protein ILUMI_13783 [Ignelater luminosus]